MNVITSFKKYKAKYPNGKLDLVAGANFYESQMKIETDEFLSENPEIKETDFESLIKLVEEDKRIKQEIIDNKIKLKIKVAQAMKAAEDYRNQMNVSKDSKDSENHSENLTKIEYASKGGEPDSIYKLGKNYVCYGPREIGPRGFDICILKERTFSDKQILRDGAEYIIQNTQGTGFKLTDKHKSFLRSKEIELKNSK